MAGRWAPQVSMPVAGVASASVHLHRGRWPCNGGPGPQQPNAPRLASPCSTRYRASQVWAAASSVKVAISQSVLAADTMAVTGRPARSGDTRKASRAASA